MFFKIGVLENFAIFARKQLCWSLFLINPSSVFLCLLLSKFLRTPILKNICKRLLLKFNENAF